VTKRCDPRFVRFRLIGFTVEQAAALADAGYDVWFIDATPLLGGTS
jgi:hypothetical protein